MRFLVVVIGAGVDRAFGTLAEAKLRLATHARPAYIYDVYTGAIVEQNWQ